MKIFEPPRASSIMIEQRETSLFLERKKKEDRSFSSPRENTYSVSSWTNLIPSEGVHQLFTVRKRYAILKLRSDFRRGISQTRFTMVATEGNTIPCKNAERGRGRGGGEREQFHRDTTPWFRHHVENFLDRIGFILARQIDTF